MLSWPQSVSLFYRLLIAFTAKAIISLKNPQPIYNILSADPTLVRLINPVSMRVLQ
ncbi:hypothetical protein XNC3_730002 [Xenorhabdus nematophila F1]|nr:hypothetical protein XNC3_730002 [Xenorhabdus nematophila F1]